MCCERPVLVPAVLLQLADEIDVSRGDVLVSEGQEPLRNNDVDAMVVWMTDEAMTPGRQYLLQHANGLSNATVTTIHHRVDIISSQSSGRGLGSSSAGWDGHFQSLALVFSRLLSPCGAVVRGWRSERGAADYRKLQTSGVAG